MSRLVAILSGVLVILVFSIYPVRLANSFCCFGVVIGGLLGTVLIGRTENFRIESTVGLKYGARVGIYAAVIVLLINLLFVFVFAGSGEGALDPFPEFIYRFLYAFAANFIDIAGDSGSLADTVPGIFARFMIQLFSNALFGAFGGAIGASLFRQEPPVSVPVD